MKQFQETVCKASDLGNSLGERHEAFGKLVIQFQDMAFACAYAILGDAYLAEDVAQEAFLVAWQKIAQLRVPAAFPGWLKRIVLTQCHRLTRSHRLQVVSLETGANDASPDAGPHAEAEKRELLIKVLTAIKALPDNERLVTTLFYVNEYTQADIAEFLEVPCRPLTSGCIPLGSDSRQALSSCSETTFEIAALRSIRVSPAR